MILKRSYEPEIMDDFSIQDERIDRALDELKNANRFLGGAATSRDALKLLLKNIPGKGAGAQGANISILDVGAGASDNLLALKNKFPFITITGLDLSRRACLYLKNTSGPSVICADTINIPVKKKRFDIVHASLFLHHFSAEEIISILKSFREISKLGIIVNDLHRSIFALAGIKLIASVFSKSEMFKNDGPLSVKRGFIRKDLIEILSEAGVNNYTLKWRWAFRWMLVIYNKVE